MDINKCKANGGQWKDNRCVYSKFSPKKSVYLCWDCGKYHKDGSHPCSNNPFKMWGSWLGAILMGGIVAYIYILDQTYTDCVGNVWCQASHYWLFVLIIGVIFSIPGFLAGWGIHTVIKKIGIKKWT